MLLPTIGFSHAVLNVRSGGGVQHGDHTAKHNICVYAAPRLQQHSRWAMRLQSASCKIEHKSLNLDVQWLYDVVTTENKFEKYITTDFFPFLIAKSSGRKSLCRVAKTARRICRFVGHVKYRNFPCL